MLSFWGVFVGSEIHVDLVCRLEISVCVCIGCVSADFFDRSNHSTLNGYDTLSHVPKNRCFKSAVVSAGC